MPPRLTPLVERYKEIYLGYQPEDARYLTNHRGHPKVVDLAFTAEMELDITVDDRLPGDAAFDLIAFRNVAIYLDARALLPHIPPLQYPGIALVNALYMVGGVRAVEIGTLVDAFNRMLDQLSIEMQERRLAESALRDSSLAELLHAYDYQVYAYLQMRRDSAAKAVLARLPSIAARFDPTKVTTCTFRAWRETGRSPWRCEGYEPARVSAVPSGTNETSPESAADTNPSNPSGDSAKVRAIARSSAGVLTSRAVRRSATATCCCA